MEKEVVIANPIYDVVFKYMMEDNLVARLVVSSIIGEQVVELEPKPQERTAEKQKRKTKGVAADEEKSLTVYRLDFSAKIKTSDGYRAVIIEMQKASVPTDIMRFRSYLGKQYSDMENSVIGHDGKRAPIQIYAIYFLGKDLEICDTPVLSIDPVVRDVATQQIVEEKSSFISLLNHKGWIVQISCLKQRRRNELETLLSVFDQANRTSDIHILNVCEEDFPEKYRPVIRRLKMAASSKEVKRQMEEEDSVVRYLQDIERGAHYEGRVEGRIEGRIEGRAEGEAIGLEKGEAIGMEKAAINCRLAGLPIETIAAITGLTPEQITEILKRNGVM